MYLFCRGCKTSNKSNFRILGFILVLNYSDQFRSALEQLSQWIREGKLKTRENIVFGIENAGKAFVDMMNGSNIGKQLVKVA